MIQITEAPHLGKEIAEMRSFADNIEFLEAKSVEMMLLLDRAAEMHGRGPAGDARVHRGGAILRGERQQAALPSPVPPDGGDTNSAARRLEAVRDENSRRLAASSPDAIPFISLVRQFQLDSAAQDVIWMLFFKATSADFRRRFAAINADGPFGNSISIGDILAVLYPGDYAGQLAARRLFAVDQPLLGHSLARIVSGPVNRFSVLEAELILAGRIIHWISGDENQYSAEMPFIVERPTTTLEQVILPESVIGPILRLVERYDDFVRLRKRLGVDAVLEYGKAIVILEYGPPGTGKTLLARAISRHTGKPLVSQRRGSDALGPHRSARGHAEHESLDMLFREAQLQNGIVFLDECEGLCSRESPFLRELLAEIEKSEALVIMTTNRPDDIATAMDRRITLKVPFEIPSAADRRRIWELLLPKDVSLAPDVNIDCLARAYPFSGGFIKNAVLAALNIAASRNMGDDVCVTQADLEEAARLQERHIGRRFPFAEIQAPRFDLAGCVASEREMAALHSITRTIRNYRGVMSRWGWKTRISHAHSRGFKVLFHGDSFTSAADAAEAIAGELSVRVARHSLRRLVNLAKVSEDFRIESPRERFDCPTLSEILAAAVETGHLTVIADEEGVLAELSLKGEAIGLEDVFSELARCEGTVIVVTSAASPRLPEWAAVFHEHIRFGRPDARARAIYWRRALDSAIPLAADVDPDRLAQEHTLDFDEIQTAVHKACLLKAADDPEGALDAETLRRAVRYVIDGHTRTRALFGTTPL